MIKTGLEEVIEKSLPYKKIYLSMGKQKTGAFIKMHLKIITQSREDHQSMFSGQSQLLANTLGKGSNRYPSQRNSLSKKSGSKKSTQSLQTNQKREQIGLVQYGSSLDDEVFKFDLFDEEEIFLQEWRNGIQLKVRVYILRCLSLGAQSQDLNIHQLMAGFQAKNSANAYPEIKVGDGKGDNYSIKFVRDKTSIVPNDLNPSFYKMYELDAVIPQDWNLAVRIMNSSTLDSEIGGYMIDLEDRILGEKMLRRLITYDILIKKYLFIGGRGGGGSIISLKLYYI